MIYPKVEKTELNGDEIADILFANYDRNRKQEVCLHRDDAFYKPMTNRDEIILNTLMKPIRALPYKKELRDCDDYATFADAVQRLLLPGRAFGKVEAGGFEHIGGGYHAMNFFIDRFNDVVFYEPQTGKFYRDIDLNTLTNIVFML